MPFPHKFIKLSFKERVDLRFALERLHTSGKTRECKRIEAVRLSNKGITFKRISRLLKVSYRSVKGWISAYQKGGLEGLCSPDKIG